MKNVCTVIIFIFCALFSRLTIAGNCNDPFSDDCVNTASSKSSDDMVVVCKNGTKIKPDGSTITVGGTQNPAGTVTPFAQANGNYSALCASVGSTFLAYGHKDSGNLKVRNNMDGQLGALGAAQPGTVNPATSSSSTTGGPGSCSSACDCPGSMDACIAGTCQTQSAMSCSPAGLLVRGDAICQWLCDGSSWTCNAHGSACP